MAKRKTTEAETAANDEVVATPPAAEPVAESEPVAAAEPVTAPEAVTASEAVTAPEAVTATEAVIAKEAVTAPEVVVTAEPIAPAAASARVGLSPAALAPLVAALRERLTDANLGVRHGAATALLALGETGVAALRELAATAGERRRAVAIAALAERPEPTQVALLREAATDLNAAVRTASLSALATHGAGADLALAALVDDPDAAVRIAAAHAVGHLRPDGFETALVTALADESVREAALEAIARAAITPDAGAMAAALAIAQRDFTALADMGDRAVPAIARALREGDTGKERAGFRGALVDVLDRIGTSTALTAALPSLDDPAFLVRAQVARALGHRPDLISAPDREPVVMRLVRMLVDDPGAVVRRCAATALARLEARDAIAALMTAASGDADPTVRFAAADAVAALGEAALLIAELGNADAAARRTAANRLGELKAEDAVDRLLETLGDSDATVRAAAFAALEAIGWTPVGVRASATARGYSRWITRQEMETRAGLAGAPQVDLLARDLASGDPLLRQAALEAIAMRRGPELAPAVTRALDDDDPYVRRTAAETLLALDAVPTDGLDLIHFRVALGNFDDAAASGLAAVAPLARALRELDAPERVEAAVALARVAPPDTDRAEDPIVAPLCEALAHDVDHAVRAAAADALAGRRGAESALRAALGEPHAAVRARAATALGRSGSAGVAALVTALADTSTVVRSVAATALATDPACAIAARDALIHTAQNDTDALTRLRATEGLLASGADLTVLQGLLATDDAAAVRAAAAAALGRSRNAAVIPSLLGALGDASAEVRDNAADALDLLGHVPDDATTRATLALAQRDFKTLTVIGAPALPLLVRALTDRDGTPDGQSRRIAAMGCLLELCDSPEAGDALVRTLDDGSGRVRAHAARMVARANRVDAVSRLCVLLTQDGDARAREEAALALGALRAVEAIPLLIRAANEDRAPEVQTAAAIALAGPGLGDIAHLVAKLASASPDVRRTAALELGRVGNPKAIDPLIGLLADAGAPVRTAAATALERLGWRPMGVRRDPAAKGFDRWLQRSELGDAPPEMAQRDVLLGAVTHADVAIRRAVAETLAELGGAQAALTQLAADPDPSVAAAARAGLGS